MPRPPTHGAPDELVPRSGWRVWDVVELDGALRLCSLAFWTIWLPRHEATALCRRALVDSGVGGLPPHDAPQASCTCGVYATRTALQALTYSRSVRRRRDTVHRIAGRVSLWGTVIECENGWRATHAYPAALFVPTARPRRFGFGHGLVRPSLPVEEIATRLGGYGVPVEIVDCSGTRGLAQALEPRKPPA
jgi:hypothetical protein